MKVIRLDGGAGGGDGELPLRARQRAASPARPPTPSAVRPARPVRPASYFLISVLFSVIFFALSFVGDHGILQVKRQRRELVRVQGQVQQMWDENQRLEAEISALKSDPRAVEKIAREDLGFAKPDEVVIRLPKGWRGRLAGVDPSKAGPAR